MPSNDFESLVGELLRQPRESAWLEFKLNNADPSKIGEYVSAVANSAALLDRDDAFLVWGVDNTTRTLVGTSFDPIAARVGNQGLLIHLAANLSPPVVVEPMTGRIGDTFVSLLRVQAAGTTPVAYKGDRWIRIDESKSMLRSHPMVERQLWARLDKTPFEQRSARNRLDESEVLPLLDFPSYFDLLKVPLPEGRTSILEPMAADRLIRRETDGWVITNLGAVLFARSLADFDSLSRKAVRVVAYRTDNRSVILRQQVGQMGYAAGFRGLIRWVRERLPENEAIGEALRTTTSMYPDVAIREFVANALIHQDFAISGAGPLIEIFPNRIEISNPGRPIIDPSRLDLPPRSRNEAIAALMRRMGMCEELGSGIDRALTAVEEFQLPAPDFATPEDSFRVTLFAPRTFSQMDRVERSRAAYQHAGLMYLTSHRMTNASLRKRFGLEDSEYTKVSTVIRDAVQAELIFIDPPDSTTRKHAKYVPYWASPAWPGRSASRR